MINHYAYNDLPPKSVRENSFCIHKNNAGDSYKKEAIYRRTDSFILKNRKQDPGYGNSKERMKISNWRKEYN